MQGLLSNELLSESSLFGSFGGSNIKSIQKISKKLSNLQSQTIPINPVDITKSIVILSGILPSNVYPSETLASVRISSSTEVTVLIDDASNTPTIEIVVIEFNKVKSLQKGNVVVYGSSNGIAIVNQTVPISTIDISKSFLFSSFKTNYSTNNFNQGFMLASITSDASILFQGPFSTGFTYTIEWQVIEFN